MHSIMLVILSGFFVLHAQSQTFQLIVCTESTCSSCSSSLTFSAGCNTKASTGYPSATFVTFNAAANTVTAVDDASSTTCNSPTTTSTFTTSGTCILSGKYYYKATLITPAPATSTQVRLTGFSDTACRNVYTSQILPVGCNTAASTTSSNVAIFITVSGSTMTVVDDTSTTTCNSPKAGGTNTFILDGSCHTFSTGAYKAGVCSNGVCPNYTGGASALTGSTTAVAVTALATAVITMIW